MFKSFYETWVDNHVKILLMMHFYIFFVIGKKDVSQIPKLFQED